MVDGDNEDGDNGDYIVDIDDDDADVDSYVVDKLMAAVWHDVS